VALTVIAILLATGGFGLMLWSLYHALLGPLGMPLSAFFTGLVALLVAGVVSWIADLTVR